MALDSSTFAKQRVVVLAGKELAKTLTLWLQSDIGFGELVVVKNVQDAKYALNQAVFDLFVLTDEFPANTLKILENEIESYPTVYLTESTDYRNEEVIILPREVGKFVFKNVVEELCSDEESFSATQELDLDGDMSQVLAESVEEMNEDLEALSDSVASNDVDSLAMLEISEEIEGENVATVAVAGIKKQVKRPKKALICGLAPSESELVANHCLALGVVDLEVSEDASHIWELINRNNYEFVVIGWEMVRNTGAMVLNQLSRIQKKRRFPVLVSLDDTDVGGLLDNYGFCGKVNTGVSFEDFKKALIGICSKSAIVEEYENLAREVLPDDLRENASGRKTLEGIIEQKAGELPFFADFAVQLSISCEQRGLGNLAEMTLEKAKEVVRENLSVLLLQLARYYQSHKKSHLAIEVLTQGMKDLQMSVEHLCLLGEAELALQKAVTAQGAFEKALSLDATEPRAKAGMRLSHYMDKHQASYGAKIPLKPGLASSLNVIGMTLVKKDQFKKAINQYRAALMFVEKSEDRARIQFNLGLTYLRAKKVDDAKKWFERSHKLASNELKSKVERYLGQVA